MSHGVKSNNLFQALFTLVLDRSQLYNNLNMLRGIKLPQAPLSILNLCLSQLDCSFPITFICTSVRTLWSAGVLDISSNITLECLNWVLNCIVMSHDPQTEQSHQTLTGQSHVHHDENVYCLFISLISQPWRFSTLFGMT